MHLFNVYLASARKKCGEEYPDMSEEDKCWAVAGAFMSFSIELGDASSSIYDALSTYFRGRAGKGPLNPRTERVFYNLQCDADSVCLSKQALKNRGWSDGMIQKYLGGPDMTVPNKYNKHPINLYLEDRVEDAEQSEPIKTYLAERRKCPGVIRLD